MRICRNSGEIQLWNNCFVVLACQNTLNLALSTTKRCWSCNHAGNIDGKMEDAKATFLYAGNYMFELAKAFNCLGVVKLTDGRVEGLTEVLFPRDKLGSIRE